MHGRIQKFLEDKYKTKFSYGTIVRLCVARNHRRISAKRYKGVANITYRKACKGFSVKFNTDAHYSTAVYHGLDYWQLKDGTRSLDLNRDDAAGFHLVTTFTHKQHASFSTIADPEQATRSDYLNKYTAVLQVSSHMFLGTETTAEACGGLVKPHTLYEKNAAQHGADLKMLEENPEFKRLFEGKSIDYIRVDGGPDEGPSHHDNQFYWTERHLVKGSSYVLVTTRHSGGSYLNRVELQNGCLAVAHSNLLIPSTQGGPCYTHKGLDKAKVENNLDLAADVQIKKVDGALCGKQPIKLVKGARGPHSQYLQERRSKLLTFLKGKKRKRKLCRVPTPHSLSILRKCGVCGIDIWPRTYRSLKVRTHERTCPRDKFHALFTRRDM